MAVVAEAGTKYSTHGAAKIMGFSGVRKADECQPIWRLFMATKDVDCHRLDLASEMLRWSKKEGAPINKGIHF